MLDGRLVHEIALILTAAICSISTRAAFWAAADLRPVTPPERRTRWPAGLTDREVEVLHLLATGASRRAIAAHLSVSEHTVRHHLEHIYTKLDVRTRVEATLFALEQGLIR